MSEIKQQNINELEKQFQNFVDKSEDFTSKIAVNINMQELDEINQYIAESYQYIEQYASNTEMDKKTKAYNQLTNVPVLGTWAQKKIDRIKETNMQNSSVKDVLEEMFKNFSIKQKRLVELTGVAENMGKELSKQEQELTQYIDTLENIIETTDSRVEKMKAVEMVNQGRTRLHTIREQVHNKLIYIIDMMEHLHGKLSKTIPSLKVELMNETSIAGMINSISDIVSVTNKIQDLRNDISKHSSEKMTSLISEAYKDLTAGTDIEFYEEAAARSERNRKLLRKNQEEYIRTTFKGYEKLKSIQENTSKQLQSDLDNEMKHLGLKEQDLKSN